MAAILKKAEKTMMTMEMQPETYQIFQSIIQTILKSWFWRIMGGGAGTPIIHVRLCSETDYVHYTRIRSLTSVTHSYKYQLLYYRHI